MDGRGAEDVQLGAISIWMEVNGAGLERSTGVQLPQRRGFRMEPWGTPVVTGLGEEEEPDTERSDQGVAESQAGVGQEPRGKVLPG